MTEDKIYDMAMGCVKLSREGCSCECHLCQFDISEYVPDAKRAALLKKTAYTDYIFRQGIGKKPKKELEIPKTSKITVLLAIIVLCIVISFFVWMLVV